MADINAVSIDFDDCTFNHYYFISRDPNRVLTENESLLSTIVGNFQTEGYARGYTFIGSNRQSFALDEYKIKQNGSESCYPVLHTITDEINRRLQKNVVKTNHFLLADISDPDHLHPDGYSYDLALRELTWKKEKRADQKSPYSHPETLVDEVKFPLVYAQMHKLASENPNDQIVFDLYDDRESIHQRLQRIFDEYPEFIPPNVTFRMFHYKGEAVTKSYEKKGLPTAIIDYHFRSTILQMFPPDKKHLMYGPDIPRFKELRDSQLEKLRVPPAHAPQVLSDDLITATHFGPKVVTSTPTITAKRILPVPLVASLSLRKADKQQKTIFASSESAITLLRNDSATTTDLQDKKSPKLN